MGSGVIGTRFEMRGIQSNSKPLSGVFVVGGIAALALRKGWRLLCKKWLQAGLRDEDLIYWSISFLEDYRGAQVDEYLIPAVLESDAKWVVEAINNSRPSYADVGIIFKDIMDVMSEFPISVTYISRRANKAAHALAKLALLADRNCLWKEDNPPSINNVIQEDSLP
ncbi:hypothetical protein Dsin_030313 [Dipteronia sinensis]|uniref:RNase H type-1 domain-containing protein n=1 Tax=Dipteronia sinensis TaxID=43782 RepID=A0AAD9ZIY6_9ROSI|nr:hypothetical protein Dsin_030313 [Dipteronia sinensis]